MNALQKSPKSLLMVLLAVGLVAGGVLSAVALGATGKKHPGHSLKASTSTTTTGTFKSNEDATHEAGESAAVEAAEDSGQRPHGGNRGNGTFKPNEDATHEAGESAAREAQEDSGQRPTTTP